MKRDHHLVPMKEELEEDERGGGMDELLAVLGYKVRSSQMADVALKLEQLEEIMGNAPPDHAFSHLPDDTLHYNPSELYSCLHTMLSHLNPIPPPDIDHSFFSAPAHSSTITSVGVEVGVAAPIYYSRILRHQSSLDSDLNSIPGNAIYSQPPPDSSHQIENTSKRLKCSTSDSMIVSTSTESTRSVILVDSQENGVRLVHALLACAEAVQNENLTLAEALVKQIGFLAVSQTGAMRKVATYFAEALARRIYRLFPSQTPIDHTLSDTLQMHFYETCPYLKFAHFTANQAILEAFEGKKRVHVIDFSMNQGLQWPALIQALAIRSGGPPAFRLTGIGLPSSDNFDYLQEVGCKLGELAEAVNVEFEYRGFVANTLADLDVSMLEMRGDESETVAVNSVFELHKLLGRGGAIEKVLGVVKEMKPEIFTVVEQESNHNSPVFLDRFRESLHYYSSLFDSLEGVESSEDKVMSEVYLGKQICNVVACDGIGRVERHETLSQWRNRFGSAGFSPVYMSSIAFKQASMLLALFNGGEGYQVEERDGCMMLGWYTRPLIATSAWNLSTKPLL